MQSFTVILLIIVAMLAMAIVGWISFATFEDGATITINTKEMQEDTEAAIDKSEEFVEKAARKGRKLINQSNHPESSQTESDTSIH
ncbi:hypothetical protein [Gimesia aquarii]|uniref:Uncharacterized protein n=1 Tax=Gimesia aquarii TaxID=2527964 RepID=A0A517WX07_9PLAN|nr:hypothetical protein [Gimesia aquarii]QDU09805.1 hypothetical protein V202x_32020 [Gimesia aquarii]